MNLNTIRALLPVLEKLEGYAMQFEKVESVEWDGDSVKAVVFPHGEFRCVEGGWVLSCNGAPMAVFPPFPLHFTSH